MPESSIGTPKFADAGRTDLADLVDLDRYPLHDPGSRAWTELTEQVKADLARGGCSVLPAFLTEHAWAKPGPKANSWRPRRSSSTCNAGFVQTAIIR